MAQARSVRVSRRASEPELTKKGAETRQRIIVTAADLIFERGVASTTLEHVRAAAGVSSSQIYHYFADKEALVLAVIDYQNETTVGGQEPMLGEIDTIEDLRAWCDFLIAQQRKLKCRGGCPIGSLGSELAETDPKARKEIAGGLARWQEAIRRGFQTMYARGDLVETANPDQLATATLAAVQGGLLLTQLQRNIAPLEATLDMVIDHVRRLTAEEQVSTLDG
jgi:TetR/AcrR family transcriptional repressor of nem operon